MRILVLGNLGSGKTFITTILNVCEKREVWSNYKINIPNYKKLDIVDLFKLKDNIVLIMDEGYSWIESRVSSTAINEYFSSIIFHSRKTFNDIYITTPMFSSIDKRFRKMTDIFIFCKHRNNFLTDDFSFMFYDRHTKIMKNWSITYKNACKYFSLYDTYEKIDSHRKDNLEFKILQKYPKRMKEYIENLALLIKPQLDKITHDRLKYHLLMNGINLSYEKLLYIYLKGN